jgi:hypothetical protein
LVIQELLNEAKRQAEACKELEIKRLDYLITKTDCYKLVMEKLEIIIEKLEKD